MKKTNVHKEHLEKTMQDIINISPARSQKVNADKTKKTYLTGQSNKPNCLGSTFRGTANAEQLVRKDISFQKQHYLCPAIKTFQLLQQTAILAGSPIVEPGPTVEPPIDGGWEELEGAKPANFWNEPAGDNSQHIWEE